MKIYLYALTTLFFNMSLFALEKKSSSAESINPVKTFTIQTVEAGKAERAEEEAKYKAMTDKVDAEIEKLIKNAGNNKQHGILSGLL